MSRDTRRALIAGGVAGSIESLATMPFEVTKNRMQMGHGPPTLVANMVDTVRRAGIGGLYYGIQPQLLQVAGKAAIRFGAYESVRRAMPSSSAFVAGTVAGITEALVWVAPTERIKMLRTAEITRNAKDSSTTMGPSVIRSSMKVLSEQGVAGLWLGSGPTAARQALANGIRFYIVDRLKQWFAFLPGPTGAYAGGIAGIISVAITNPVDVIKYVVSTCLSQSNLPPLRPCACACCQPVPAPAASPCARLLPTRASACSQPARARLIARAAMRSRLRSRPPAWHCMTGRECKQLRLGKRRMTPRLQASWGSCAVFCVRKAPVDSCGGLGHAC